MGIGVVDNRWKVGNTAIFRPSNKMQIEHTSLKSADSDKTEDGVQHNTWIRRDIVTIQFVWDALTGQEVKTLINLMQGKEFTLTYPEFGETHTANVEVGQIHYTTITNELFSDEGGLCKGITTTATEL